MIRVGTSLVHIPTVESQKDNATYLSEHFHENELGDKSSTHLAQVLACKEAFFKASGTPTRHLEAHVVSEPNGDLRVRGPTTLQTTLSVSSDHDYALATVILYAEPEE